MSAERLVLGLLDRIRGLLYRKETKMTTITRTNPGVEARLRDDLTP